MATEIRAEKAHYQEINPDNIDVVIEGTMNIFKRDETAFGKTMANSFIRRLGEPDDYLKDNEIKETIIKDYEEHIDKTIEDLENTKTHELSSKLIEQKGKALNYLEDRRQELEQYREKDEERCLEMGR